MDEQPRKKVHTKEVYNQRLTKNRIKRLQLDLQDAKLKLAAERHSYSVEVNRLSHKLYDVETERDLLVGRVHELTHQV